MGCGSDADPSPAEMPFVGGKGDSAEQAACDVCLDDWTACDGAAEQPADSARCWMGFIGCLHGEGLVGLCSAASELSAECLDCTGEYEACSDAAETGPDDARCWMNYGACVSSIGEVGLCAAEPAGPTIEPPADPCESCTEDYTACAADAETGADDARCWMNYTECLSSEQLVGLCATEEFASPACVACGTQYNGCVDAAQDGADLGACYLFLRSCVQTEGETGTCNINAEPAPDACAMCAQTYETCGGDASCLPVLASCVERAELVGSCSVAERPSRPCTDCIERLTDCRDDAQDGADLGACWLSFQECVGFIEEVGLCATDRE